MGSIWGYFGSLRWHWGAHVCPKGTQREKGGGVYCVPLQHCQSSGSLIPHKTWFQMSNTPWISNCLGRPTWFRFYAIKPSKDPQNGIGGANEAILGQQEFRKYQYVGSIMPYISGNHPDGAFLIFRTKLSYFWPLVIFLGSKNLLQDLKSLLKIYHIGGP